MSKATRSYQQQFYMQLRAALGQSHCFAAFCTLYYEEDEHQNVCPVTLTVHRSHGNYREYMLYVIKDYRKVLQAIIVTEDQIDLTEHLYKTVYDLGVHPESEVFLPLELLEDTLRLRFTPDGQIYAVGS